MGVRHRRQIAGAAADEAEQRDHAAWLLVIEHRLHVGLHLPAVVGPMQECLALPSTAKKIAWLAGVLKLLHVATHGFPAFDLARVLLRQTPAHVIPAAPLKPPAWVVRKYPTLPLPFGERLACPNAKIVERWIGSAGRQLCSHEPTPRCPRSSSS